jgi:signal transduction histidine kinase
VLSCSENHEKKVRALPRDSLLVQLILAKLVNKLANILQNSMNHSQEKTTFGRNTQYHEAWQSQIIAWEQ